MRCINNSIVRRVELQLLMNLTAKALRQPSRRIWTLPHGDALRTYAEYTSAPAVVSDGATERMNMAAYRMGRLLRRLLLVRSEAAGRRVVVALYRNIGIEVSFTGGGQLCFRRCYFSCFYTPAVCQAVSALDDGIIRGLTGRQARRLCFTQRITEGCSCCKAELRIEQE